MTKRSAMLMAAGLVGALLVGAAALSFGLSGGGAAVADTKAPDPIVRTIHRTVRVEKDAKPADQPVQVVQVGSAPASTVSASEAEGDDAFEGEHESDDGFEGEHESEGSDDSGSGHSSQDGAGEFEDD